uniref:Uncharacterized protein n=1 Tax=Arundo donax TaxID=35708 RepID=A0A0A9A646_ARUDO
MNKKDSVGQKMVTEFDMSSMLSQSSDVNCLIIVDQRKNC